VRMSCARSFIGAGSLLRRDHHVDLRCPHRTQRQSITGRETIPRRSPLPEPIRQRSPFERPRWPSRLSSSEHWRARLPTPPRIIDLSHGVERGGGVLPDELDVALRDLPGERLCSEPENRRSSSLACDPAPEASGKGQGPTPDRGRAAAALRLSGRVGTMGCGFRSS
jgi:hypothetical protein